MTEPPRIRPQRPSTRAASAAAEAKKFTAEPEGRLSIRVGKSTLWAIKQAASTRRKSVKRFVLDALKAAGVAVAPEDLEGDE